MARTLAFWWLGPYKIIRAIYAKECYRLAELDGSELQGTYSGRRLKLYTSRHRISAQDWTHGNDQANTSV